MFEELVYNESYENPLKHQNSNSVRVDSLKLGEYIVSHNRSCKIYIIDKNPEKDELGNSKLKITCSDLFNNETYTDVYASYEMVISPKVEVNFYEVLEIQNDDILVLIDEDGSKNTDFVLSDQANFILAESLKERFETDHKKIIVEVTSAMGLKQITSFEETSE